MKRIGILILLLMVAILGYGQEMLTPEALWKIGRVSPLGISTDKQYAIFSVSTPDLTENKSSRKTYKIPVKGGMASVVSAHEEYLSNSKLSPNGKYLLFSKSVQELNVKSTDKYPDLPQSNAYIFTSLNYRHWDTWEDGAFDHVFVAPIVNGKAAEGKDIMAGEPFDCPQKPFGGEEDYIWSPDGQKVIYVTKKKFGTDYTISTNTDLYEYDLKSGVTKNLTENNKGYDQAPAFGKNGELAWLQMKRDGYEADKQDIVVKSGSTVVNLTAGNDEINVNSFVWNEDGKSIFFTAPINGTVQLFQIEYPLIGKEAPEIKQRTRGDFDITGIVGQAGNTLILSRTDMNRATELFTLDIEFGDLKQLTHVNDAFYAEIGNCKTERQWVTTTDGKKMLVWVMASQGYIVVAPNRRGMPGHGTKWNEAVSKDWGGQVIKDYLSAIDAVAKQPYVDKSKLGCVGASFGGFSVFALEAEHQGRFKTFISHDGVFDFRSMYGTTDEMFFENWEKGGPYWDKRNKVAQRSFSQSPSNFVDKWDTPIFIIQGGKDYRVPIEQGQQAFQAAQLRGIKSKFLYLPEENHWVLNAQNAMVWQREFFGWLKETL